MRKRVVSGASFFAVFAFILFVAVIGTPAQTVWAYCAIDTSVLIPQKGKTDKFERRFYVTELVSMSKDTYLKIDATDNRIGGNCADYLNKTAIAAAEERGEKISATGEFRVVVNIDHTADGIGWKFVEKSDVEENRSDAVKEMLDAGRDIYIFNWDISGANADTDLKKEKERRGANIKKN